MFGFLIGTACLIGLISTIKRARWAAYHGGYGYGGHCGGGGWGHRARWSHGERWGHDHHHGWGGWGGYREGGEGRGPWSGGFGRRGGPFAMLRFISERLDLTPAQEKVVRQGMEEVRDAIGKHRGTLRESRQDLAKAFRAPSFDAVLLGDLFGKHDNAMDEIRKAVVGALSRVHDALDEQQRERLASMLEGGWW